MNIRDYVEHLKSKPEHVRQRIALGASAGFTAVVLVGWVVALGASGTLALSSSSSANSDTGLAQAAQETKSGFSNLLGAASAYQQASQSGTAPLTIVGGRASSTLDQKTDANEGKTVIPF